MIKEKPSINDFFKVTENIYPKSSLYVSLFKSDLKRFLSQENPLFSDFGKGTYFVAYKNQRPVGRIVAHIHQAQNDKYNELKGYFGFLNRLMM